eukprot:4651082-Lingulodinium_polyedra.AAC.1
MGLTVRVAVGGVVVRGGCGTDDHGIAYPTLVLVRLIFTTGFGARAGDGGDGRVLAMVLVLAM